MAQIFKPKANTIIRAGIVAVTLAIAGGGWALYAVFWSPYTTVASLQLEQPVPFSHQHHAGDLGIDCRYCHTSVEDSAFAGFPPTETCMTCHSQLWTDAPVLAPVRESLASGRPIRWQRVHDLPDFVFFNHSIHVSKGIGCATCHGRVDQMPLTWKEHTLYMKWCLECHRDPARFVRPRDKVFDLTWRATNQVTLGHSLLKENRIQTTQLTDCSMCHR